MCENPKMELMDAIGVDFPSTASFGQLKALMHEVVGANKNGNQYFRIWKHLSINKNNVIIFVLDFENPHGFFKSINI